MFKKLFSSQSEPVELHTPSPQYVILRDEFVDAGKRTAIEVSPESIKLTDDEGERLFPLDTQSTLYGSINEEIRAQIARKIARMVPVLAESKKSELQTYTFRVIEQLAYDQSMRVRQLIAEEVKEAPGVPKELVERLAWDTELPVRVPILEFSPLLDDNALLDIIASSPIPGILEAISRRQTVNASVSTALVMSNHAPAIEELLYNSGACIEEESMQHILEMAPTQETWHEPLLLRPELTQRTMSRLAGFVSSALVMRLEESGLLSAKTAQNLSYMVATRLQDAQAEREREAEARARQWFEHGRLTVDMVSDIIEQSNHEMIVACLALLSGISKGKVRRILQSKSPRAVTALSWKAGLPMRLAIALQLKVARIDYRKILNARQGVDYPISEDEMHGYLEFFAE